MRGRHRMHGFMHRQFGEHGPGWGRGRGGFMEGMRGGGGRRGRMFEQGALRVVALRLLEEKPRHGYEIIKAVEEAFGGNYSPSPGIVYPTLTLLEEMGYARVSAETGGKKLYEITAEGRAHLAENKGLADGVFARMEAAKAAFGGGPPAQIIRAVENLRMSVRLRLQKGELSEEQIAAIADALDNAARKIESI